MSVDEWKLVTKDDKKRVMRRRGRRNVGRNAQVHSSIGQSSNSIKDPNVLYDVLQECQNLIAETSLFQNIVQSLKPAALTQQEDGESPTIRQIVCYGIGNFSHTSLSYYSASLWQLACVLCLRERLSLQSSIEFYDPCCTPFEASFLADKLHVTVLTVNKHGNRPIAGIPTLFFMPHCPSTLYENVLWANYSPGEPFVLLGNSLRNHCDSLNAKAADCPCMHTLLPWLCEERIDTGGPKKKASDLPGNFEGAFNDTYISFFSAKKSLDEWPTRPYDRLREDDEEKVETGGQQ